MLWINEYLPEDTVSLESWHWKTVVYNKPDLAPEIAEWCDEHIGDWRTAFVPVLIPSLFPNSPNPEDNSVMMTAPVIIFDNPSDTLAFRLRWVYA